MTTLWTNKPKTNPNGVLLLESGGYLLQESGFHIVLDQLSTKVTNKPKS